MQLYFSTTFLNFDLLQLNIESYPFHGCQCPVKIKIFFYNCPSYINVRHILWNSLSWLKDDLVLDLKIITAGGMNLTMSKMNKCLRLYASNCVSFSSYICSYNFVNVHCINYKRSI